MDGIPKQTWNRVAGITGAIPYCFLNAHPHLCRYRIIRNDTSDEALKIDPLSEEGARPSETKGALEFKNIFFNYPSRPNMQVGWGVMLWQGGHLILHCREGRHTLRKPVDRVLFPRKVTVAGLHVFSQKWKIFPPKVHSLTVPSIRGTCA